MSVTVSQQPEDYTLGYNPQLFVALSTQVAQDNFVYTVEVTDLITGDSIPYQIPADPNDDRCYFDAMPFVENYIEQFIAINSYGWHRCSGAIRKIRVNIGETYGATGAETHFPGTDIDYIVWNGVEDYLQNADYNPDDYLYYAASGSNLEYLSSDIDDVTFADRSNYLYVLTTQPGDVLNIQIETSDAQGNLIGSSTIANPWEASTTYTDKYLCIDVGPKGLAGISGGSVTGDYPIWTDQVASYTVVDAVITGDPASGVLTHRKNFTVGCEPEFDIYTIHFLAKSGAFETIQFNKRSDIDVSRDEKTYRSFPYTKSGGTMTYSRHTPMEKTLSSARTERMRLNTDWLDEDHVLLYEQILDSPVIYLDQGSAVSYSRIKLVTNSYKRNKAFNEGLFQLTMDFEYSHKNYRQR